MSNRNNMKKIFILLSFGIVLVSCIKKEVMVPIATGESSALTKLMDTLSIGYKQNKQVMFVADDTTMELKFDSLLLDNRCVETDCDRTSFIGSGVIRLKVKISDHIPTYIILKRSGFITLRYENKSTIELKSCEKLYGDSTYCCYTYVDTLGYRFDLKRLNPCFDTTESPKYQKRAERYEATIQVCKL